MSTNVFQLNFRGYNDKQDVLVQKVMDKMVNFKVDPKRFEIWKENVSVNKKYKYY